MVSAAIGGCQAQMPPTAKTTTEPTAITESAEAPAGSAVPANSPVRLVRIAAASDLRLVLPQLIAEFRRQHPECELEPTFAASGTLSAQIQQGAPFDLFLSADRSYPERLVASGHGDPSSQRVYAIGELVVWSAQPRDWSGGPTPLHALQSEDVRLIAIANPEHAPYGKAAMAAFESAGLVEELTPKLVRAENVSQVAQFAETSAVEACVLSGSLVRQTQLKERGSFVVVPKSLYPPLEQTLLVLKSAANPADVARFAEFLQTPAARELLITAGFGLPPGDELPAESDSSSRMPARTEEPTQ
jgi:molybdate transport system substrate-binding protein